MLLKNKGNLMLHTIGYSACVTRLYDEDIWSHSRQGVIVITTHDRPRCLLVRRLVDALSERGTPIGEYRRVWNGIR